MSEFQDYEYTPLRDRFHNLSRGIKVGIFGCAAAIVATAALGIPALIRTDHRDIQRDRARRHELEVAAKNDGFNLEEEVITGNDAMVTINLGKCSLGDVSLTITKNRSGHVVDASGYNFSGLAFGHQYQQSGPFGRRTEIDGQPVTFTFESRSDLINNILGKQACQTLAASTIREDQQQ